MNDPFQTAIAHRAAQRAKWKAINTLALEDAGLTFSSSQDGEIIHLQELPGFSVDGYVCDQRWVYVETGKVIRGPAKSFLNWYIPTKEALA
jgi:hypothetical protein